MSLGFMLTYLVGILPLLVILPVDNKLTQCPTHRRSDRWLHSILAEAHSTLPSLQMTVIYFTMQKVKL